MNIDAESVAMAVPVRDMTLSPELRLRVISAAVLAPLTLALIWLGGPVFLALLIGVSYLLAREWVALVETWGGALVLASLCSVAAAATFFGYPVWGLLVMAVAALAIGVMAPADSPDRGFSALGPLYVGGACVALMWLRMRPEYGFELVLWLFLVVWATDIGAYFVGRSFGGAKLARAVSPGKTWSGLFGGVGCAAAVGGVFAWAVGIAGAHMGAFIGAVLAVVAQLGDLFESLLKRRKGVKDSGNLIPGHGGLLDRVDGVMTAAPGLAVLAWLIKL